MKKLFREKGIDRIAKSGREAQNELDAFGGVEEGVWGGVRFAEL